jgi:fluoride exporter
MRQLAIIFIGGGSGSVVRYLLGRAVTGLWLTALPIGTLVVNVIACGLVGVLWAMADERQLLSSEARLLLAVGFCGGMSTFSTFGAESIRLMQSQQYGVAFAYIGASLMLCLLATYGGMWLMRVR